MYTHNFIEGTFELIVKYSNGKVGLFCNADTGEEREFRMADLHQYKL